MVCKMIQHRLLIYSFVAFLLSCCFCAFGMSSESYATSYSCSGNITVTDTSWLSLSDYCESGIVTDSSSPIYVFDLSVSATLVSGQSSASMNLFFQSSNQGAPIFNNISATDLYPDVSYSDSGIVFVSPYYLSNNVLSYHLPSFRFARWFTYVFSFKVSDDIDDIYPPTDGALCPDIPENPYDNKLDDIKKAIYVCGAILIMLYFFFCIYKIVVKDGGSR